MRRAVAVLGLAVAWTAVAACDEAPAPRHTAQEAQAYGEPQSGFANWRERMIHVLVNRARADPPADLAGCSNCADAPCFTTALPPMEWHEDLNHSARFHAANLTHTGCGMSHTSPCTLVSNIDSLYPSSCDGQENCACSGNVNCGNGTDTWARLSLFGVSGGARAENIAPYGDPFSIFYMWLWESTSDPSCAWSMANGHRHNILGGYNHLGAVRVARKRVTRFMLRFGVELEYDA